YCVPTCYRNLRDSPSCPTRRSSDLGECGWSSQTASGEVTGPGKQTLHRAVQLVGKPGGDPRHRGNLQARPDVDAVALQEIREVLRRDVAGRGRSERATTESADRGVERDRPEAIE